MLSRRALTAALGKTGLLSLASGKPDAQRQNSATDIALVRNFDLIKTLAPEPAVTQIVTDGYSTPGIGAATYLAVQTGTASRYCVKTANDRWFELANDQVYVEKFGARADSPAFDDYPAIASAVNYLEERGGGVLRCHGARTYHLSQTLKLNPTLTSIEAEGATWLFTQTDPRPAVGAGLLKNGDFSDRGDFWTVGQRGKWSFEDGTAIQDLLIQNGEMPFLAQKIEDVQAGERVFVSLVIESTNSSRKTSNILASVRLVAGIDDRPNLLFDPPPSSVQTLSGPGVYHFPLLVPANAKQVWFAVCMHGVAGISDIALRQILPNPCLEVAATAESDAYGQARRYCRGLRIVGPGAAPNLADGILFDTATSASSSRWALYSCEVASNLRRALILGDRAYLLQAYSCRFSGSVACIDTIVNPRNGGESVDFFGCTIDNGGVGISNLGGMEIRLFGGSIDYCEQFYVGNGEVSLFGTHLEMAEPQSNLQIPVELTAAGDFRMDGGTLLVAPAGKNDHMFFGADRFSRVILQDVAGYGWPSSRGELMGGAGRLLIDRVWWGPNHNITPVPKREFSHSVFGAAGSFEGPILGIGVAVLSPAGTNVGPHLTRYLGGTRDYSAQAQLSRDRARTGSQCLKVTKRGWGSGTETTVFVYAPVDRRRMISCEFWYSSSGLANAPVNANIWFTFSFCQICGFDAQQIPIIAATQVCQEFSAFLNPPDAPSDWRAVNLGSMYADQTSPSDGYGPDWVTHMLLSINLVQLPAGSALYLDNLFGFCF